MTMRCVLCRRPLDVAAVFFAGYPVGPVCARRARLTEIAERGTNEHLTMGQAARRGRARDTSLQIPLDLECEQEDTPK